MSGSKGAASANLMDFIYNSHLYDTKNTPYMWNVNSITVQQDSTAIVGWCLPHAGRLSNTYFLVNNVPFEPVRDGPKGLLAEKYPWHPNAAFGMFSVTVPHSVVDVPNETELSMTCVSKSDPDANATYTLDVLVKDLAFQMPPDAVAARIGVTDRLQYVMYGRGIYRGFERALQKNFDTSFADYGRILDWGCGSARVARHVLPVLRPASTLIGFDIDEHAVNWSNENVGRHFDVCKTEPPLSLPSASVDVAYAYSVFTHLAQDSMKAWVEEMARVIKPGGIGLFTVLSENAMIVLMPNLSDEFHQNWKTRGIWDSAHNDQLETMGVSGDYYRNVWFKRDYLANVFGRYFDVVDFVGTVHFYQDLLVLRRR